MFLLVYCLFLSSTAYGLGCNSNSQQISYGMSPSSYPNPRRDLTVVDNYHGTNISDPYRWMENPDSQETKQFVTELNDLSSKYFGTNSSRKKIVDKLHQFYDSETKRGYSKHGHYYYYFQNSNLYKTKDLKQRGFLFLDVVEIGIKTGSSFHDYSFSPDGSLFAYQLSQSGSDLMIIKFKNANGNVLPDILTGVKYSSTTFTKDSKGLFYMRYRPNSGPTSPEMLEFHLIYYHKMGTKQEEDILIYEDRRYSIMIHSTRLSSDGQYLIIMSEHGASQQFSMHFIDLHELNYNISAKPPAKAIFSEPDAYREFIDKDDEGNLIILTSQDAPLQKLIKVNVSNLKITTIVPEHSVNKLQFVNALPNGLLASGYIEDVKTSIYIHESSTGEQLHKLPLDIGTVSGLFSRKNLNEAFFYFTSFLTSGTSYRLNFESLTRERIPNLEIINKNSIQGFKEENFIVRQEFYSSKDGTRIPIFIVSRKDIKYDGSNPTYLYGYGGFNIIMGPHFSATTLMFLQHFNGVYAVPAIRGGGEYGEAWHNAGIREKRQNVFDDMEAAAEYLIKKNVTSPKKLAIYGGSNGGLLVGVCAQQRPDLFGAVLPNVGLFDMLRYHKFTIGAAWIPEFGDPEDPKDFKFIKKYSPLHNISPSSNTQWPSTLVLTGDHDDRVVPSHSLKYTATLMDMARSHNVQRNPLLARIGIGSGHGKKPLSKQIEEQADIYSFLERALSLKWVD